MQKHKRKTPSKDIKRGEESEFDYDFQPSTFGSYLRTLFGEFSMNGILYVVRDFNKNGTFLSWLNKRWEAASKIRSDFGTLPKQAIFDPDMDFKLRNAIENNVLRYKTNFKHFTMLIIQLLGKASMLRGASEVRKNLFFCIFFLIYTNFIILFSFS